MSEKTPGGSNQPCQDSDNPGGLTPKKYDPEDFSKRAINRGQRKINYQLNQADKRVIVALTALRDAIAKLPGAPSPEILTATKAICEAQQISATVADIIPPGCSTYPP